MDFDEYDYLEKMAEDPEQPKEPPPSNGDRRSSKHRQEDDEVEAKRPSSRSKGEGDRARDRASGSNERPGKDRPRDRDRDREDRGGRGRETEKNRGRDMEKSRERVRERNREPEWERDRERDFSRRSRVHAERQQEDERERPKERESRVRDRPPKEKEMREREPFGRRQKEKKEDGTEPEADPERDQRTVFAYQIHLRADERDVYEFFSRAGKVRDVRLIMDRNSRRSKGVGYIEFYDALSVPMAIALSGQLLMGQPVMVKPSEAEKNFAQSTTTTASSGGGRKLYVGNLHLSMTEEQLRQVFEPFGQVELVQLPMDPETQKCKGYGFIQFARLEDAKAAQNLNGQLEIAGRVIKVSAVTDQPGVPETGTNAGDFDDDGDLALNASSRALLMQKLDRSGMATSVGSSLIPAGGGSPAMAAATPQVDPIGVPSECLLLKNMFDPSLETEPDFDLDIKEDVQEECSKFGPLKHISVDKNSTGHVYLRFESTTSAISAQRALHGRWFAGKMITATFMLPLAYLAKFPESG